MLIVLPFHNGDADQMQRLLRWIQLLGGCPAHDALIVADAGAQWDKVLAIRNQVISSFRNSEIITNGESVSGWPRGANSLWLTAARWCHEQKKGPWLFLEPDAVPLKVGWADALAEAYAKLPADKTYMGAFIRSQTLGLPEFHMNGVALYPADCIELTGAPRGDRAFDIAWAERIVPQAQHTDLIHCIWGQSGNPPMFAEENRPGTNIFCPRQLKPQAVLFHRNKDGSLIRLLQRELGLQVDITLAVVLPYCQKDHSLLLKNLHWQQTMAGKLKAHAILHHDGTAPAFRSQEIEAAAKLAYAYVQTSKHSRPKAGNWPVGPNWSFQRACEFMAKLDRPWLWLEPDAIPLRPDWLEAIDKEYLKARKPFMGTIIGGMDHMNGVGVYPAKVMEYAPSVMRCSTRPWDVEAIREIAPKAHRANHLIYHCRAMGADGRCHDCHGSPPTFRTQADLQNMTTPEMAIFHPSKDGSLIDQLLRRHNSQ